MCALLCLVYAHYSEVYGVLDIPHTLWCLLVSWLFKLVLQEKNGFFTLVFQQVQLCDFNLYSGLRGCMEMSQCRSWSDGFIRSQLIWIYTVFKEDISGFSRTRVNLVSSGSHTEKLSCNMSFQKCGTCKCNQQRLRPACAYTQSDQNLC